jgi:SagB-type dehydrogenase family enzyme
MTNDPSLDPNAEFGHALVRILKGRPVPPTWRTDWTQQPDRFKTVDVDTRIALDPLAPLNLAGDLESPHFEESSGHPLLARLGHWLAHMAAPTQLRTSVRPEHHRPADPESPQWVHATRRAASGGALYPWEVYLIALNIEGLEQGAWHYDAARHALAPLGTVTITHAGMAAPGLLVICAAAWKNHFKYANAALQLLGLDAGVLVAHALRHASAFGFRARLTTSFDDAHVLALLRAAPEHELPLAVLELLPQREEPLLLSTIEAPDSRPLPFHGRGQPEDCAMAEAFALFTAQAEAPFAGTNPDCDVSADGSPDDEPGTVTLLPRAERLVLPADFAVRQRRRQSGIHPAGGRPLASVHLADVCASAWRAVDRLAPCERPKGLQLFVAAHDVSNVEPGIYTHDSATGRLRLRRKRNPTGALQAAYHLDNLAFESSTATLFVTAPYRALLTGVGNRVLRTLCLAAGMMTEGSYAACTLHGLGCHAILGFDDEAIESLLGLDGYHHWVLLGIVLGAPPASDRYSQVPTWV